jgi:hypothetical protein
MFMQMYRKKDNPQQLYIRLPVEFQLPADGCCCKHNRCKDTWDTLAVYLGGGQGEPSAWTVHFPGLEDEKWVELVS